MAKETAQEYPKSYTDLNKYTEEIWYTESDNPL